MANKPSMGRQKIKIAKIEIKNHLQVTFSKWCSRLYKKAHELSTLCGVELAIVIFSPAGKVFSFRNPNVDNIINRFTSRNKNPPPPPRSLSSSGAINFQVDSPHGCRNANNVRELNSQLTQIVNQLEAEKKRGEAFDLMRKATQNQYWWEFPTNELQQLRDSMEALKKNVIEQAGKVMAEATNSSTFLTLNHNDGSTATVARYVSGQYESKATRITLDLSVTLNIYGYVYEHRLFLI